MSYEFVNMFPYNAGIILANLPTMRENYDAFLTMMLDNNDGLYYINYGPADQGIINKVSAPTRTSVRHGTHVLRQHLYRVCTAHAFSVDPLKQHLPYMLCSPPPQFYEKDLKQRMLDPVFNTKPYNPFEQLTFILHFHGPKPLDLLNFVTTGKCDFSNVCENAFLK